MPRLWPDPRDPEPRSSRTREILFYFSAAAIGAMMIADLARGVMGLGWNW